MIQMKTDVDTSSEWLLFDCSSVSKSYRGLSAVQCDSLWYRSGKTSVWQKPHALSDASPKSVGKKLLKCENCICQTDQKTSSCGLWIGGGKSQMFWLSVSSQIGRGKQGVLTHCIHLLRFPLNPLILKTVLLGEHFVSIVLFLWLSFEICWYSLQLHCWECSLPEERITGLQHEKFSIIEREQWRP